ncbi:MAG: hypothetical protein NT027_18375 [Proteobacteria bacterium]|nr:hypothetical protein [Pseudomonadota bacterium]
MHAGLNRLLELIRVNPQDTLLVDRFLILASDLKENERVDVTLGLSEALLRKNPSKAIDLAYMVYKARPGDFEPLEIMVEGLENLGRYGKATVLRQQLENVKKAKSTNLDAVDRVIDDSIIVIGKELDLLAKQPSPRIHRTVLEDRKEILDQKDEQKKIPSENIKRTIDSWEGVNIAKASDQLNQFAHPTVPGDQLSEVVVPGINDLNSDLIHSMRSASGGLDDKSELSVSADENLLSQRSENVDSGLSSASFQKQSGRDSVDFQNNNSVFRPVAVERNEFSSDREESKSSNQSVQSDLQSKVAYGVPAMPAHLDDQYAYENRDHLSRFLDRNASISESNKYSDSKRQNDNFRKLSFRAKPKDDPNLLLEFERQIDAKNWDVVWSTIETHWHLGGSHAVMEICKRKGLERVDLRFMGWWLDMLIGLGRNFQAFSEAKKLLQDQPHVTFARAMYPRLKLSLSGLGLKIQPWTETDGVVTLIRGLSNAKIATPAGIAITNKNTDKHKRAV